MSGCSTDSVALTRSVKDLHGPADRCGPYAINGSVAAADKRARSRGSPEEGGYATRGAASATFSALCAIASVVLSLNGQGLCPLPLVVRKTS